MLNILRGIGALIALLLLTLPAEPAQAGQARLTFTSHTGGRWSATWNEYELGQHLQPALARLGITDLNLVLLAPDVEGYATAEEFYASRGFDHNRFVGEWAVPAPSLERSVHENYQRDVLRPILAGQRPRGRVPHNLAVGSAVCGFVEANDHALACYIYPMYGSVNDLSGHLIGMLSVLAPSAAARHGHYAHVFAGIKQVYYPETEQLYTIVWDGSNYSVDTRALQLSRSP